MLLISMVISLVSNRRERMGVSGIALLVLLLLVDFMRDQMGLTGMVRIAGVVLLVSIQPASNGPERMDARGTKKHT